jgi:hypothetical protein
MLALQLQRWRRKGLLDKEGLDRKNLSVQNIDAQKGQIPSP